MRDLLYVWFESEIGMGNWPGSALPLNWTHENGLPLTHGRVVVSKQPAGVTFPNWKPVALIGPVEIAHGEAVALSVAQTLHDLGHVVFAAGGELRPGVTEVGKVRYPIAVDVYCRQPIYGTRPLPAGIPNHSGRAVQVLVNAVGGLAWINVLPEDVELSK